MVGSKGKKPPASNTRYLLVSWSNRNGGRGSNQITFMRIFTLVPKYTNFYLKRPPGAVEVCPKPPKPGVVVVEVPKPAGLLPKRPVLPAVDVGPKAEVEALKR